MDWFSLSNVSTFKDLAHQNVNSIQRSQSIQNDNEVEFVQVNHVKRTMNVKMKVAMWSLELQIEYHYYLIFVQIKNYSTKTITNQNNRKLYVKISRMEPSPQARDS
jgi:hypothetical protein